MGTTIERRLIRLETSLMIDEEPTGLVNYKDEKDCKKQLGKAKKDKNTKD